MLAAAVLLGAQAPRGVEVRIADDLSAARAFLCGDCDGGIDPDGVNRAMRRVMLAQAALARVRDSLAEADGPRLLPVAAQVAAALAALETLDECTALNAVRSAQAALRAAR